MERIRRREDRRQEEAVQRAIRKVDQRTLGSTHRNRWNKKQVEALSPAGLGRGRTDRQRSHLPPQETFLPAGNDGADNPRENGRPVRDLQPSEPNHADRDLRLTAQGAGQQATTGLRPFAAIRSAGSMELNHSSSATELHLRMTALTGQAANLRRLTIIAALKQCRLLKLEVSRCVMKSRRPMTPCAAWSMAVMLSQCLRRSSSTKST